MAMPRRSMFIRPFWHCAEYPAMVELLREIVVFGHIIGFAVTFGAWVAEAAARRFAFTAVMNVGLALSFLTGLALAAPWPAGVELNYPKIVAKLVICAPGRTDRHGHGPSAPLERAACAAGLHHRRRAAVAGGRDRHVLAVGPLSPQNSSEEEFTGGCRGEATVLDLPRDGAELPYGAFRQRSVGFIARCLDARET